MDVTADNHNFRNPHIHSQRSNSPMSTASKIIPLVGPSAHSDEWNATRLFNPERKGREVVFGASEAADACNLSPYSAGPLELFMKKRSLKPAFEGNDATEYGQLIEPVVLTMYER